MHQNKYLLVICCIVIIFFVFHHYEIENKGSTEQAQSDEPVMLTTSKNIIDSSILLPPEKKAEKPKVIVPPRDPNAISAESYVVGNLESGEMYLDFNSNKVFPIASLSKLFTASISDKNIDPLKVITITQEALDTYGDAGHLVKDEKFTAHELLYPLLLESSNDAAEVLAQSFGYKEFITSMNSLAVTIGMVSTSFKDASGLSPSNISNTKDLFLLAQYLYKNEKPLLEITKQKEVILATTTDHGYHDFISINPFAFYEPFIGGKTGRTDEAKESMITLLNYKIATTTYPIAIVVLRSQYGEREPDTEKILDKFSKKIQSK